MVVVVSIRHRYHLPLSHRSTVHHSPLNHPPHAIPRRQHPPWIGTSSSTIVGCSNNNIGCSTAMSLFLFSICLFIFCCVRKYNMDCGGSLVFIQLIYQAYTSQQLVLGFRQPQTFIMFLHFQGPNFI